MTTPRSYRFFLFSFLAAFLFLGAPALSAQEDRVRGIIDENDATVLKGDVQRHAVAQNDAGPLDPTTIIHGVKLVLGQTARQTADLEQLLEDQRDPSSPDYRNWLSPEQFAERFGMSPNDIARLSGWLQAQGFAIEQVARARNWITFTGSAERLAATFRTEFRRYEVDGEKHFANASNPSIPAALAGIVVALRGLDDFRAKPLNRGIKAHPEMNGPNGLHYIAPADFAAIYDLQPLYEGTYDGSGQKLVIAGQTDINLSDIRGFRSAFNLAAKDPQLVLTGTDPGVSPDDQIEADLDLEWSGAVARNATIVYVYSQDVFESVQYAVDQNLAPVISVSYGGCETDSPALSYVALAQQANAEGITWINASGDSGAAGCDGSEKIATQPASVTFPADIPEVTGVGGTEFNEGSGSYWNSAGSALSYIPEKAWNDTALGDGLAAGGGGASAVFAKPWWQAGTGVPDDRARDVPDVSLSASGAHDAYAIFANGELMYVGGTSVASPSFAGIVAILNQYLVANQELAVPGLGNLNPSLYSLAQNVKGPFHDITTGDNIVPCAARVAGCVAGSYGYQAGTGYDLATGLGSVDAESFVTKWAAVAPATGTTMTLSASPASIAETAAMQLTATVSAVSGSNPPSGTVTFADGAESLGTAVLAGSGTTASATLSAQGTSLSVGDSTITATYAATAAFSGSSASAAVTVTQPPVIATSVILAGNPASLARTGSTVLTAVVKPASGNVAPSGSVVFSSGKAQLGSATLASSAAGATATLTLKAVSLTVGSNSVVATYAGGGGFGGSASAALTVTVAPSVIATTVTLAANPASFSQNSSTTLTATVKPVSGSALPTGTVTFTAGNTPLATVNLSASVATGVTAAKLTVKGTSLTIGDDTISAVYSGSSGFASSTGTTTVVVIAPSTSTTLMLTAIPSTIAPDASTVLTATIKATGSASPTGSVTFDIPSVNLGSSAVTVSGAGGAAALTVKGSVLALGANTITATYTSTGNLTGSNASVVVTVLPTATTVHPTATTMTLTANPANLAQTGSTQLTATVTAVSGSTSLPGSVTFLTGKTTLGSVAVTGSGGTGAATLTLKGNSLAIGANTISAIYAGTGFAAATASTTITVKGSPDVSRQAKRIF